MKRLFPALCAVLLQTACLSQPIIHRLEDFSIGTVLRFSKCATQRVSFGDSGANKTWDYSMLSPLNDTVTEWMVAPTRMPYAGLFPNANLVEKYSDGKYIYVNKAAGENHLLGYVDTVSGTTIQYPNDILFAKRPMTYGTAFTDSYTDTFVASGYHFRGAGTSVAVADGYGTLKLPGRTYPNVLRVKIYQEQTDTLLEFGTTSITQSFIYAWFDDAHAPALLKIDSIKGSSFLQKDVQYLVSETTTAVTGQPTSPSLLNVYPNPVKSKLYITRKDNSSGNGELLLTDLSGKILSSQKMTAGKSAIDMTLLPQGIYQLRCTIDGHQESLSIVRQ